MPDEWDAVTYDRISDPMTRWGTDVLARLALAGDERVLDAGCGTGRVTEQLLARLPLGHVVAVDGSSAMLVEARRRLGEERVSYVHADLGLPLPLDGPVDAILSTATFHWVPDHDALFANLAAALRPGGSLVAQCGGVGNIANVVSVAAALGRPLERVNFTTPEATVARLRASGFRDIWAWLHPEPTAFTTLDELEGFLATVVLRGQLEGMGYGPGRDFVRDVAARLPHRTVDYVRLNLLARKA